MAHVPGHGRISAPLEQIFDTMADSRNEPSFNPAMTDVGLLTPAPIRRGRTVPCTRAESRPGDGR